MQPTDIVDMWGYNASLIDRNLWQSGVPTPFKQVPEAGIDVVVFCSSDRQAHPTKPQIEKLRQQYPGLTGITCLFDDTSEKESFPRILNIAHKAADKIVEHLHKGARVLVTCSAGRNRSSLVSALTLMRRHEMSGLNAFLQVKKHRDQSLPSNWQALTNSMFANYLKQLPAGRYRP